jgi:hypothetical protein
VPRSFVVVRIRVCVDLAVEQPSELRVPIDELEEQRLDDCELAVEDENVVS